jgi:hypothetical protein
MCAVVGKMAFSRPLEDFSDQTPAPKRSEVRRRSTSVTYKQSSERGFSKKALKFSQDQIEKISNQKKVNDGQTQKIAEVWAR